MSSAIIPIVVGIVCAVIFGIVGFVLGGEHRRRTSEKEIGSATQEAILRARTRRTLSESCRSKSYPYQCFTVLCYFITTIDDCQQAKYYADILPAI